MLFGGNNKKSDTKMFISEQRKFILNKETDFSVREAYNALRSNITFSIIGEKCKVISFTSTLPSEGKSINALNVALSFADVGKRVLLIDCDLRKPKLHSLLDIESTPGFSNIIVGDCDIDSAIRRVPGYSIDIITAGDIPPISTRLLESDEINEFFYYIKKDYDYIIIDTPPIEVVIDSCILAKYTNGTVFVVRENYASKERIIRAVKQFEFAGGKILGYLLNGIALKKSFLPLNYKYRYEKGYEYYYSDDEAESNEKIGYNKKIKSKSEKNSKPKRIKKEKAELITEEEKSTGKKKLFAKVIVKKVQKKK